MNIKEDYEVVTGFWDRGHFRGVGETVTMCEAEARTHVFAGCIKKVVPAAPVEGGVEAASNAG